MAADARQRPEIQEKYEKLYGLLKICAEASLKSAGTDGPATFRRLKESLPAIWALLMESGGGPVARILPMIDAYNARACEWYESGVKIAGTNLGWDQTSTRVLVKALTAHLPANCDLVMDLGCGWGHRMVDLWLGGGPATAEYRGGERSGPGLEIIDLLGRVLPGMNIVGFPFDFLAPDFTAVQGDPSSICVYTYLAIEQVRYLGPALFDKLLERFPKADITGVHLEPFGFQAFSADDPNFAMDRDYATAHGYNLDLFEQVSRHPRLKIIDAETGLLGQGRGNAIGLLVWRRAD